VRRKTGGGASASRVHAPRSSGEGTPELAIQSPHQGLAVLVPLLVVTDFLEFIVGEAVELLPHVIDAQVVVVLYRRGVGSFARPLASSVLATYSSPFLEPSRFFCSVARFSSSLSFSPAFFGRWRAVLSPS
jgi:hypothetical protein